jgi:hypothetical protein
MPGERIEPGKIFINKQTPTNTSDTLTNPDSLPETGSVTPSSLFSSTLTLTIIHPIAFKGSPMAYKGTDFAYIDKVLLTSNSEDHFLIKVHFFFLEQKMQSFCNALFV